MVRIAHRITREINNFVIQRVKVMSIAFEYSRQFKSRARIGLFDFCARRNSSSRLIAAGTSSSNALSLTGKIYKVALTLSVVLVSISTSPSIFSQTMLEYPQTKKQNQVDKFFGVEVADPYRWLEDDVRESKEVEKWVNSENEVTFAYIEGLEPVSYTHLTLPTKA